MMDDTHIRKNFISVVRGNANLMQQNRPMRPLYMRATSVRYHSFRIWISIRARSLRSV